MNKQNLFPRCHNSLQRPHRTCPLCLSIWNIYTGSLYLVQLHVATHSLYMPQRVIKDLLYQLQLCWSVFLASTCIEIHVYSAIVYSLKKLRYKPFVPDLVSESPPMHLEVAGYGSLVKWQTIGLEILPRSHPSSSSSEGCAAANQMEQNKVQSTVTSPPMHTFTPVVFETSIVCGPR